MSIIDVNSDLADGSGANVDNDEASEDDNDEGLIIEIEEIDEEEHESLRMDMLPVKQVLSKV